MSRIYFTDRDLGNTFPDILISADLRVERHRDHFAPDCSDEEWLEACGKNDWVAITHDSRIRYKPNELASVVRHRAVLLVVIGKARFPDLARNFVATAPRIDDFLTRHSAPLIAKVYRPVASPSGSMPGSVSLWYPPR